MTMFLHLKRPEYLVHPELLVSELLWNVASIDGWVKGRRLDNGKIEGRIYDSCGTKARKVDFKATHPEFMEDGGEGWQRSLRAAGMVAGSRGSEVGRAVADSISGRQEGDTKRTPVAPLSPSVALLQDIHGSTGKENPPNLGLIIEQLFRLASPQRSDDDQTQYASQLVFRAMSHRLRIDPFLGVIDRAVQEGVIRSSQSAVFAIKADLVESLNATPTGFGEGTPFGWLRDAIVQLCSDEWVEALSARRWLDWVTTAIRTGLGMGFLWEAQWYVNIARSCENHGGSVPFDSRIQEIGRSGLLLWKSRDMSMNARSVRQGLTQLLACGSSTRKVLGSVVDRLELHEMPLEDQIRVISTDRLAVDELRRALVSPANNKNLNEAVRYSLQTRSAGSDTSDHYGLLRNVGSRAIPVVEPATEWIALVASLSAGRPAGMTTLGGVRKDLARLGLRPDLRVLVGALGSAGLTSSAPDADEGLYVRGAF